MDLRFICVQRAYRFLAFIVKDSLLSVKIIRNNLFLDEIRKQKTLFQQNFSNVSIGHILKSKRPFTASLSEALFRPLFEPIFGLYFFIFFC